MCLEYGKRVSEEAFEVPGSTPAPNSQASFRSRKDRAEQVTAYNLSFFNFTLTGSTREIDKYDSSDVIYDCHTTAEEILKPLHSIRQTKA